MYTGTLNEVDGAYSVTVPQNVVDQLHLRPGSTMNISVEEEHLVLRPERPRYTLEQLLEEHAQIMDELPVDRAWIDAKPVGREIL